ncbi:TRAP transporter permease [Alkalihalobacillus oceani]|uniref:TRAP transporter permease n=1 Tax=Halalkalibacter oceani TaxID=1653776 RepID=A0A9X2DQ38_9BACI|nr:TRAP transporter permease [Halalkalibacter oceani]MCM3714332.1 TRAP transporter permease [Halalkalibacter oceani]
MEKKNNEEELIKKFDSSTRYRKLTGVSGLIVTLIAISFSLFHLYTAQFGLLMQVKQRSVHLAFLMVLIFLLYPALKKSNQVRPTVVDWIGAIMSLAAAGYLLFGYDALQLRAGVPIITDYIFGALCILLIFETTRRAIGYELPILGLVFILYGYFGYLLPGSLGHSGYSIERIIEHLYLSSEGIFGIALGVSSTYIFLFILFGAILGKTGLSQFINDFSMGIAGHKPGGPAKIAILGSSLMGTINGSAVANVASTGAFTIPLMKEKGYKPHFAASVEAVSSTGGQLVPPVMGAAAFIMIEYTGIPYSQIMLAALVPALLFYLALWFVVENESRKLGLKGVPKEELPNIRKTMRARGHLLISIVVIFYLLIDGYTPLFAAFWGIVTTILASFLRKETRLSLKDFLNTLENGAKGALGIGIACALVGFIVGITSLTSIGLTLGNQLISFANGNLVITLFLTMVISIILGMGLPTTAAYIVAAVIATPPLIQLGVPVLAAHMFVFYYACLSNITPPVALAAYTGAAIAGERPNKVGWTSFRLALSGYIIPFMFVYSPILLLGVGDEVFTLQTVIAIVTAILGVYVLTTSLQGFWVVKLNMVESTLLFVMAIILINPGWITDTVGTIVILCMYIMQRRKGRNTERSIINEKDRNQQAFKSL